MVTDVSGLEALRRVLQHAIEVRKDINHRCDAATMLSGIGYMTGV